MANLSSYLPGGIDPSAVTITGGTINGTAIGASTAAAGTFTTFTSTGIDDNATSTAVTIDSSQNIGIGTASPQRTFHVSSGATNVVARLESTDATSVLEFKDDSGTVEIGCTGNNLVFSPAGIELMRLDSSGNLGIGTTSPGAKLDVDGNVKVLAADNTSARTIYLGPSDFASSAKYLAVQWDQSGSRAIYYTQGAYPHTFWTNNTERMRIDSSGNVGIGTSSPASKLEVNGATGMRSNGGGYLVKFLNSSSTSELSGFIYDNNQNNIEFTAYDSSYALAFKTNNTERMRIDSSGNVLVGTTTATVGNEGFRVLPSGSSGAMQTEIFNDSGGTALAVGRGGSNGACVIFKRGSTTVGSVSVTATTTTYNTSSDQRLKENIVDAPAGNIDAIRVRSFDWKSDGSHQTYGMIAQELVDVAPEAVSQGETEDDMWGVDYSKLVPMMIKEIQDLKAEVAALKGA